METLVETTGFIICTPECESEEEAQIIFMAKLKWALKWLNGYKYWRTLPEIVKNENFDVGETVYVMKARIILTESLINNGKEISADEPFSNQSCLLDNYPSSNIGFGLA